MTPARREPGRRATVAAPRLEGARRRLTASSPVPDARERRAWTCRLTELASKRSISSRIRSCLNSRQAMISPTRSAISWPARDAPLGDLLPRVSIARHRRFHPTRRLARRASRTPEHGSPIGSASLAVLCRRVLHVRRTKCGIGRPLLVLRSRRVRVGGIARTDRVGHGPSIVRSPGVQTALRIDCLGEPPRSRIAIEFASPARRRVLSPQGHRAHVFPSLCRVRTQGRGPEPRAFGQIETKPPGRWGNAGRSTAPAPQSKPVTHASRLVAQVAPLVALRLRAENPGRRASSTTTLLRSRVLLRTRSQ